MLSAETIGYYKCGAWPQFSIHSRRSVAMSSMNFCLFSLFHLLCQWCRRWESAAPNAARCRSLPPTLDVLSHCHRWIFGHIAPAAGFGLVCDFSNRICHREALPLEMSCLCVCSAQFVQIYDSFDQIIPSVYLFNTIFNKMYTYTCMCAALVNAYVPLIYMYIYACPSYVPPCMCAGRKHVRVQLVYMYVCRSYIFVYAR